LITLLDSYQKVWEIFCSQQWTSQRKEKLSKSLKVYYEQHPEAKRWSESNPFFGKHHSEETK